VRPHRRGAARKLWRSIHLCIGLTAGAVLAILGATGSLLVFSDRIDRLVDPSVAVEAGSMSRRVSADEAVTAIARRYGARPTALFPPKEGQGSYRALLSEAGAGGPQIREVLVNASNAEVVAGRVRGTYLVSVIHGLHSDLMLGRAGTYLLAVVSLLALFSMGSGIYLWWPRGGAFRKALAFRWQRHAATLNFEVHRISGFYLIPVMFAVAVSGLYLVLPAPFSAAVANVATVTTDPVVHSRIQSGSVALPLSAVDRAVQHHFPGALVTSYSLPEAGDDAYEAWFIRSDAANGGSEGALWMGPHSGEVLRIRDPADLGAGDRFLDLQIDLHNGRIMGLVGEGLVFLTGLAMPVFYGTGLYLWRKRRVRRR
jgi:uncharacterized iron-regulated membrane protein